jgi:hypothetical protein
LDSKANVAMDEGVVALPGTPGCGVLPELLERGDELVRSDPQSPGAVVEALRRAGVGPGVWP